MIRSLVTCALVVCACSPGSMGPPAGGGGPGGNGNNEPGVGGGGEFEFPHENGGSECGTGVAPPSGDVLANDATRPPPPISGGTMAFMPDGTLVVADSDRDLAWLVAETQIRQVVLPPGSEPGRVVAGPPGHAFVALRRAGTLVDLDLQLGAVASTLQVCSAPRGLAWSADTQRVFVACAGGELTRVVSAGGTLAVESTTFVADDLRDVVIVPDGLVLTTFRHARVLHLNASGAVTPISNDDAFVPDFLSFGPEDAGEPNDEEIDAGPPFASKSFNRRIAWRMVSTPKGALIVHQRAQATQISPQFSGSCEGGSSYGSINGQLGTVHTAIELVGDAGFVELAEGAVNRDMVLPVDIAMSALGKIAVISAGSSEITVTDAVAEASGRFSTRGQPTAVTFSGETAVVFTREPSQLLFFDLNVNSPPMAITLPGESVASAGHTMFHRATANQIACASCHPEAGDDGHVWQLVDGARRTPSLRGGLTGTAPFHWAGDQADMNALMDDVFVKRMGGAPQSPANVQLLQSWLDTQAPLPAPPTDAAKVAAGLSLFTTACSSCHAGAEATNNTTVDVGTGGLFQVPRLHELWYRAPFMHDGRAATLADRFGPAGGTNHGNVTALDATQMAQLMEYLKSR